jgi:hypothetical protein
MIPCCSLVSWYGNHYVDNNRCFVSLRVLMYYHTVVDFRAYKMKTDNDAMQVGSRGARKRVTKKTPTTSCHVVAH